ncbi:DUF2569 family protein [Bradyrhizobium ottawaense]|uniref:DUF2569 family protein n=1 Tax=Bradyrhizobium ottawaense TaxID=931866 RepID=UPI0030C74B00
MVAAEPRGDDSGEQYFGIRGWLVIPAILHPLLGAGYSLYGAASAFESYSEGLPLDGRVFILSISLGAVALGIAWLAALYYAWSLSPIFPKFYIWLTLISVFFPIAALLYSSARYDTRASPQDYKDVVQSIVIACIWIPYMLVSKRVQVTFAMAPLRRSAVGIAQQVDLSPPRRAIMGGFWYLAKGGQPSQPLAFDELMEEVLRQPDPLRTYVWHTSFSDWQRAENVRDIANYVAASFLSRSASYPAVPPPIPVTPKDTKRAGESKWAGWAVLVAVIVGMGIVRQFNTTTKPEPTIDPAAPISGKTRESFVKTGLDSCVKKQESDPETKAASFSREILAAYCTCYIDALAQTITNGDLQRATPETFLKSDVMKRRVEQSSSACLKDMQKKMLGG